MKTLEKTTQVIKAGTLMPKIGLPVGTNLPVLHRGSTVASPPVSLAKLPEMAKKLSKGAAPESTSKVTVRQVSKPKQKLQQKVSTYLRPSAGFD